MDPNIWIIVLSMLLFMTQLRIDAVQDEIKSLRDKIEKLKNSP